MSDEEALFNSLDQVEAMTATMSGMLAKFVEVGFTDKQAHEILTAIVVSSLRKAT